MNTSDTKSAPHAIHQTDGFDRLVVSSHLHRSVLDALPAQIAVLDQEARLIAVNRAWRAFSAEQVRDEHDLERPGSPDARRLPLVGRAPGRDRARDGPRHRGCHPAPPPVLQCRVSLSHGTTSVLAADARLSPAG
jgi:PAS domain-containing protein